MACLEPAWRDQEKTSLFPTSAITSETSLSAPLSGEESSFGDYELLGEIGRGGMGVVYRARQRSLNRRVALKVIRDGPGASEGDMRRFRNESEAAATLDHPHIVPIYEVGEQGGHRFFSMKLFEGGTLARRLPDFLADPQGAARLMAAVARAVHHAHERGILHRDLKPSNILIDDQGLPLVADFGRSRRIEGDSELTVTGAVLGTPSYMAPEQATGRKGAVTTLTDVHGLGAILYTLLTGRPPFRADSAAEAVERARSDAPDSPSTIRPETDQDLETICLKCLEKDPSRRYASARAVAEDLERWIEGRPILARPVSRTERAWRFCRRNARAIVLSAAAIGLLATGAVGFIVGRRAHQAAAWSDREARRQEHALHGQQYSRDVKHASQLCLDNRPGEALELLDPYRPSPGAPDFRSFAWHYVHRLATVGRPPLRGHRGEIYFAVFSPDGTTLATAGQDRTARLWDSRTGTPGLVLQGHNDEINWVAFSPDGRKLATASDDRTVKLWDTASGHLESTLDGHDDRLVAAVFTPDGRRLLACGRNNKLVVWDLATSRKCGLYDVSPNGTLQSAAISPDGRALAVAGERAVICDLAGGRAPLRLEGYDAPQVNSVAFSHDGRCLAAAGKSGVVNLWETDGWKLKTRFRVHRGDTESWAVAPHDRTLVSVGGYGIIQLWDCATRASDTISTGQDRLWCAAFSPDGRNLATTSKDGTVKLWQLPLDRAHIPIAIPASSDPSIAISADGRRLIIADDNGSVWTHDMGRGHLISVRQFGAGLPIRRSVLSHDGGLLVTVAEDGTTIRWDVASGRRLEGFRDPAMAERILGISPGGEWIAEAAAGNATILWDTACGSPRRLEGPAGHLLVFSPRGDSFSIWGWGTLSPQVWDLSSATVRSPRMAGHKSSMSAQAFSPDGALLASGSDAGAIILWAAPSLDRLAHLYGHEDGIGSLAFSQDSRTLASGGRDRLVRLWDIGSRMEILTLKGHSGPVKQIRFSPDGSSLATWARAEGGGCEVFLWRATPD